MSLGSQVRQILGQAYDFRQSAFGEKADGTLVEIEYNEGEATFSGYYSPVKSKQATQESGFLEEHDCIVRVPKSILIIPQENASLTIRETVGDDQTIVRRFEIMEIQGSHNLSVEWVLGCKALNADPRF